MKEFLMWIIQGFLVLLIPMLLAIYNPKILFVSLSIFAFIMLCFLIGSIFNIHKLYK